MKIIDINPTYKLYYISEAGEETFFESENILIVQTMKIEREEKYKMFEFGIKEVIMDRGVEIFVNEIN